jgi:hypothetical protein
MRKNKNKILLLISLVLLFITFSENVYSQSFDRNQLEGQWIITRVQKLQNTQGVVSKSFLKDLDTYQKKISASKNGILKITKNYLLIDKKTKKNIGWPDFIVLYNDYLYERMDDNALTIKYPGDELADTSAKHVGNSFMKIIGSHDKYLRVVFCHSEEQAFMVCIINKKKMAIYAVDQNILMICIKKY